ncbi:MAG TPA: NAD(P)-binding domain-containing protein [Nocardioidaceae bacterium]|nr:NAD(P)-binding domain-containing protein [Nocardioidaceae bacterium]
MQTTTVVVGAGHCGLTMSRCLADRSIDHVVLERGEVASSWRTKRWDSLRLLTPNWMTRLPGGYAYRGDDPDGYLTAQGVARLIDDYARDTAAPVLTGTTITAVHPASEGYVVRTDQNTWHARTVVLASGACAVPVVPAFADQVPAGVVSVTPDQYRNPAALPSGGVLVVGASATGVQLAEELQRSGRQVTVAVGEHVRVPRRYRGRDIFWWLDATGVLDERAEEMDDLVRARHLPSMQLVGADRTVDLNSLQALGVRVVGKLAGICDGHAQFSGSLRNVCALADLKLARLLDTIDAYAGGVGERPAPTEVADVPLGIDLRRGEIRSVVWATGIKADFSWVDVPVFDARGRLKHDGGVTPWPGLYVIGLPLLRRRRSTFIDGAAADAADLAAHLAAHLDRLASASAS